MINHQSTRRSRIIPRACRPLHPAKFARCSLRCAPLAASRGKISGALFPRVFLSQAGPPRRGHTRAMAAYHSGPHNLRKKTPGKTPLLPRGAAYGHRLRAGGRAVGAHRPTQPGSAGNRTSAQACAARSALPAPPPWFVHRAPLHRPGPACGRFRGARRWPIQQPAPLRLTWPARAPRLAPSLVAPRAIRAIKAKGAPAGAPLLYHGVPWCTTVYHATRALISAQPHHRNHPCGTAMRPYAPLSGACGASADHHPPRPGRPRRFAR